MKIKTATKLGLIGAIIAIVNIVISFVFQIVTNGMSYEEYKQILNVYLIVNYLFSLLSSSTLAIFFYVLYKNQK